MQLKDLGDYIGIIYLKSGAKITVAIKEPLKLQEELEKGKQFLFFDSIDKKSGETKYIGVATFEIISITIFENLGIIEE